MALVAHVLPPSSVNAPFYGYLKLQLHGTEESRNRRRSNDGDQTGDPPAQEAARKPTELRLLLIHPDGNNSKTSPFNSLSKARASCYNLV